MCTVWMAHHLSHGSLAQHKLPHQEAKLGQPPAFSSLLAVVWLPLSHVTEGTTAYNNAHTALSCTIMVPFACCLRQAHLIPCSDLAPFCSFSISITSLSLRMYGMSTLCVARTSDATCKHACHLHSQNVLLASICNALLCALEILYARYVHTHECTPKPCAVEGASTAPECALQSGCQCASACGALSVPDTRCAGQG